MPTSKPTSTATDSATRPRTPARPPRERSRLRQRDARDRAFGGKTQRILKLSRSVTLDRIGSVDARAVVKYRVGAKQYTIKSKLAKATLGPGVESKLSFKFTALAAHEDERATAS